mgnify:CR=1 FL=1
MLGVAGAKEEKDEVVAQLVAAWEAWKLQERLRGQATLDEMERCYNQNDGVLDRVNHLYETTLEKLELLERRMRAMEAAEAPRRRVLAGDLDHKFHV